MSEELFDLEIPERVKLRAPQCPKCSRFARAISGGQDSNPDSLDYWYTVDCSKCGVRSA